MPFRVMSFDSGGVRSMVSALLLKDVDPNGRLAQKTDLFVGTSSGAIVALALAYGIRAGAIADFFAKNAAKIYESADTDWNEGSPFSFEQQIALDTVPTYDKAANRETIKSVFQTKFLSKNLRHALMGLFGNARLSELPRSGPQVAVAALQLGAAPSGAAAHWQPVLIGSGRKDPLSDMLLADAAMASMATPTLFAPFKPSLPMGGEDCGYFADGCLFAANPSMAAIEYAHEYCRADHSDMEMVSFGTGKIRSGIDGRDLGRADCWGAWQWMKPYACVGKSIPAVPLINGTRSASAQMARRYASMILNDRYIRADFDLTEPARDCDSAAIGPITTMVADYVAGEEWAARSRAIHAAWAKPDEQIDVPTEELPMPPKSRLSQIFGF